jgi:hypothetical protein
MSPALLHRRLPAMAALLALLASVFAPTASAAHAADPRSPGSDPPALPLDPPLLADERDAQGDGWPTDGGDPEASAATASATAATSDPSRLLRDVPTPSAARQRVGSTTDGTILLSGLPVAVGPAGQIDWSDPHGRGRSFQRLLHGQVIVADLAALALDGDAQAARRAMDIVDHWAAANPRHRPAHVMAWHDETTAMRTMHLLTLHEAVTGADRTRLESLLRSHVELLLTDAFHNTGTNHGMFQDRAILAWAGSEAGTGELRTSATATATRRLLAYFAEIISPDGVHLEHSPAYHQVIFANINRFVAYFKATGDATAVSRLTRHQAELVPYATHVLQPNGIWPMVGDTSTINRPSYRLSDDPGYRYAVTRGQEGTAPASTDAFFRDAGYAIMRDSWEPGPAGTYLHFTAAYHNHYHKHADDLSLWIYHHGELLTEAGPNGYEYDDPLTTYGYEASAHNTMLVDGAGVPRHDGRYSEVALTDASRSGAVSTATGRTGRLPHGSWQRQVRYDRGAPSVTVTDRVDLDRSRRATLLWHTAPGVSAQVASDGTITFARRGVIAARMTVTTEAGTVLRPTIKRGAWSPIAGWRLGGGEPVAVTTLSFDQTAQRPWFVTSIALAPQPPAPVDTAGVCGQSEDHPFTDVGGVHAPTIGCAYRNGIVAGVTATTFRAESPVTRAQLTSMLARALETAGSPVPAATRPDPFLDVTGGPHAATIAAMAEAGLVQGVTADRFAPGAHISRAQAASLLARSLVYGTGEPLADAPAYFVDVAGTHALAIRQVTGAGLVAGDGRVGFAPAGELTRAQAATLLTRLLAAIEAAG